MRRTLRLLTKYDFPSGDKCIRIGNVYGFGAPGRGGKVRCGWMRVIEGGVTAAQGFEAAGVEAAVKYENRKDMAIVYSRVPCRAAGS